MPNAIHSNPRRIGAWAGMIGPSVFVIVFLTEGQLRPGYDPLAMYVSELSLGPRGWIQILNFLFLGISLLLLARTAAGEFPEGAASKCGPLLFVIMGMGFLVSGVCVTDSGTLFTDQASLHGKIHGILGAMVFSLMPVSCYVLYRRFRADQNWRWLGRWTFAAGVLVVVFILLLKAGQLAASLHPWIGLIQRVTLIVYFGWVVAFAFGLNRRVPRHSEMKS